MTALVILVVGVLVNSLLGLLVLFRGKRSQNTIFFFLLTISLAGWSVANHFSVVTTNHATILLWMRSVMTLAVFQSGFFLAFALTFPDHSLRIRPLFLAIYTILAAIAVYLTQTAFLFKDVTVSADNSMRSPVVAPGMLFFLLIAVGSIAAGLYFLISNYLHSRGRLRAQISTLFIGIFCMFFLIIAFNVIAVLVLKTDSFVSLGSLYTLPFVIATSYAIITRNLFDIRIIIKRTVIYTGLLAFALGSYSMVIYASTAFFGGANAFEAKSFISNLLAAGLIAIGYDPLRRFLTDKTDSFLFKKEYEEQAVLLEITKKLNDVIALDEALEAMMKIMVKTLHLKHAISYVFQPGENGQVAIKRIKQIGYSSSAHLTLEDKDFVVSYFSSHRQITEVQALQAELNEEKTKYDYSTKKSLNKVPAEAGIRIRESAIKQAVVKKLDTLGISLAIPLHLDDQPIGLILLSDKLSGDIYSSDDIALLNTIGSQVISSITKAKLFEGDQMKSEFVSIASHELLTPISAIEGYLSMILDEGIGKVDPQARAYLEKVFASSKRLATLIKDLLSVSRIESGKLKIDLQSLDMNKMISDTMDQLKFVAADKKLKLEYVKPAHPLPAVWADPDRTMQIMVNLVGNGIKYTPEGSVTIQAQALTSPHPCVRVDIVDTGLGMTKQAQSHLFEKFYRVNSPQTEGIAGTGLGLYITKSLIEKMGGTLTVKSAPGKGSTFSFTLPLFKVEKSTEA